MPATLRLTYLIAGTPLSVILTAISGDEPPETATVCAYVAGQYTAVFNLEGLYYCQFLDDDDELRYVGYARLIDDEVADVVDTEKELALTSSGSGSGSGSGDFLITVTVTDSLDQPIRNAIVRTPTESAITDVNGIGRLLVDTGTHLVTVRPPAGYVVPADTSVVVSGASVAVTIEVASTPSLQATNVDTCVCTIEVVDARGAHVHAATITAAVVNKIWTEEDQLVIPESVQSITNNGIGQIELLRNTTYQITVTSVSGRKSSVKFDVPDQESVQIAPITA